MQKVPIMKRQGEFVKLRGSLQLVTEQGGIGIQIMHYESEHGRRPNVLYVPANLLDGLGEPFRLEVKRQAMLKPGEMLLGWEDEGDIMIGEIVEVDELTID